MKTETFKQSKATLFQFISQPEFERLIDDIELLPIEERFEHSKSNFNVEALKEKGITITEGIELKVRKKNQNNFSAGGFSICVNLGVISVCYAF